MALAILHNGFSPHVKHNGVIIDVQKLAAKTYFEKKSYVKL